ncbi:prion-inhibition and propagation-domain-containing protein [Daldinia bambusicola]|nr:prion-inhibition and propagation-domain-containing protein [Daldinia bambusicola]
MDPGTAVGAISLVVELFTLCIRGCQVILEIKDFPQKYNYLRVRLDLECLILQAWWAASGFTDESTIQVARQNERGRAAVESLEQMQSLILEAYEIKQRHGHSARSAEVTQGDSISEQARLLPSNSLEVMITDGKVLRRCLQYAGGVFSKFSTRLRWVVSDAARFEKLVIRFIDLNRSLYLVLNPEQRDQFLWQQDRTQVEVLRRRNNVDQIPELWRSCRCLPSDRNSGRSSQGPNKISLRVLETLARFKAINTLTTDDGLPYESDAAAQGLLGVSRSDDLKLSLSEVELQDNQKEDKSQRVSGTFNGDAVWIEWKCYDVESSDSYCRFIERRIEHLTTLLLKNPDNPEKLHLPAARGYVHDPASARFGLVFESPTSTSISVPESLYARLQIVSKPSLTTRIEMALRLTTSLEYLHVAKWLHKGLRSDNILFLTSSSSNWTPLCLSGFDYSRPSGDRTELPTKRGEHDLYRHPEVQFDVPRDGEYGYEEKHDVYSLGVVLMEIGLWQPIHHVVGLSLNERMRRPDIRRVREDLLEEKRLASLESEAGKRFSEAAKLCLLGNTEPSLDNSESLGNIGENVYSPSNSMDCLQKAKEALQSIII